MKKNILKTLAVGALVSCGVLALAGCTPTETSNQSEENSSIPVESSSQTQTAVTTATIALTEQGKGNDYCDYFGAPNATANVTLAFNEGAIEPDDIVWQTTSKTILGITVAEDNKSASIKLKAEGDATLTVKVFNKDGSEVVSNGLKFRVEGAHKKNADFEKTNPVYVKGGEEKRLTIDTLYRNCNAPHMNSLGGAHVLVIPFGFTDTKYQAEQTKENLAKINTLFFGTKQEVEAHNGWQSLKSFYQTSSYGKSNFDGYVPENWCVYNGTASSFETSHGNGGPSAAEYGRSWYLAEYDKENHGALGKDAKPLSWFDSDNDGFIDLVWIVYSHETIQDTDWWAYVTYTGKSASVGTPNVKTLGWASLDWAGSNYDAHTYIHETGHTYGLPDYYDYNNIWSPVGGVDFMSNNVGDQSMYSKFQLGWADPWVVDDDAIITLRPGTTTGDFFILPSPGYNGTPFDEYFTVELMAPVGVAEYDYKNGNGFSQPGIRIMHVDARAYGQGGRDTYMTSHLENAYAVRIDNSYGGRRSLNNDSDYWPVYDKSGKEIKQNYMTEFSIMESSFTEEKNWKTSKSYTVGNQALFTAGKSFTLSSDKGWATTFMPSQSNLWNKAKSYTGWAKDNKSQTGITIDEECTFNYEVKVLSIDPDPTYGYTARVQVIPNAY